MQEENFQILLFLAEKGGLHSAIRISTAKIAQHFGISQQSASRKLRLLAADNLISLSATPAGSRVQLTEQGIALLKNRFVELQQLFEKKKASALAGTVKIGLGEGKYYVSKKPYLAQFKKLLGFVPFFGTLNLIVGREELNSFLAGMQPILIEGFETRERSFGPIKAFKAMVEGKQQAAIIFPERSTHPENEIEVIAPINLRKKFGLREGSKVTILQ